MPKVSVTIPVYNGATYLKEAIDSVLAQTYRDFEVIVVNDGSTDNSDEVLRSYCDKIRYYYQENQGLAKTRNKLVDLAKGEYITFIDQDDLWLPNKLTRQVELLDSNPELGLVYSDCAIIDEEGRLIADTYYRFMKPAQGQVFDKLLVKNFISMPTVIMRKQLILDAGGFSPDYKITEEYDLFLKVARQTKFGYLPDVLAKYRQHETNSSRDIERTLLENITIFEGLKVFDSGLAAILDKRLNKLILEYCLRLIRKGKLVSAWQYFTKRTKAKQRKSALLAALARFLFEKSYCFVSNRGRIYGKGKK